MPRSKNRHRGPRLIPVGTLRRPRPKRVLMPQLLGRVVRLAREGVEATQQEVALHLGLPISSVSKLERGDITMSAYHLEAFAAAFTHFEERLDEDGDGWEGWELLKVAAHIADSLDEEQIGVYWAKAKTDEGREELVYISGKHLAGLVHMHWPEEYADRLLE